MELKDYIANTLVGISEGLHQANVKMGTAKENGDGKANYYFRMDPVPRSTQTINYIEFDILVGYEQGEGAKAGVLSVLGGFGGEVEKSLTLSNRIKFKVQASC